MHRALLNCLRYSHWIKTLKSHTMKKSIYKGKKTVREMIGFISRRYPVLFQSLGEKQINDILRKQMRKDGEPGSGDGMH